MSIKNLREVRDVVKEAAHSGLAPLGRVHFWVAVLSSPAPSTGPRNGIRNYIQRLVRVHRALRFRRVLHRVVYADAERTQVVVRFREAGKYIRK